MHIGFEAVGARFAHAVPPAIATARAMVFATSWWLIQKPRARIASRIAINEAPSPLRMRTISAIAACSSGCGISSRALP